MLLVDASVVILSRQESLPMAQSVTKLLPRATQDYTHRVMLNNCVSARWSSMYLYLALISLRDSQPLATRHSHE